MKVAVPGEMRKIRQLLVELARKNDWGYTRIPGELRELSIKAVSRLLVYIV